MDVTGCAAPCAERKSAGSQSKLVGDRKGRTTIREAVVAESMAKNAIQSAEIVIDVANCPHELF